MPNKREVGIHFDFGNAYIFSQYSFFSHCMGRCLLCCQHTWVTKRHSNEPCVLVVGLVPATTARATELCMLTNSVRQEGTSGHHAKALSITALTSMKTLPCCCSLSASHVHSNVHSLTDMHTCNTHGHTDVHARVHARTELGPPQEGHTVPRHCVSPAAKHASTCFGAGHGGCS